MITYLQNNNYNQIQYRPSFKARRLDKFITLGEESYMSAEFFGRRVFSRIADIFERNNDPIYKELLEADVNSSNYIEALSRVSRLFSNRKVIDINIEDNRLSQIATSGKPHIFIMNHDQQLKDPKMLAFFNTLLNDEYLRTNQALTCPRPKIILNEDIVLSMNEQKRNLYLKMGAIPIDARIYAPNSRNNATVIIKLMKQFLEGKANIFIFPEGKLSKYKYLPLVKKFQTGIAEIVTKLSRNTDEVRVTPLGFAYSNKKSVPDSIYIGETIKFKKDGENLYASRGNVSSPFAGDTYKRFFADKEEAVITSNSTPVTGKEQGNYVAGILCENLRICKAEAKAALEKKNISNSIIEY